MASLEYQRFIESMKIGYEQWHDGIGYDLESAAGMTEEEREKVQTLLIQRLASEADWRDVEALGALGTPGATAALRVAARHRNPEVRNMAIETLVRTGPEGAGDLEDDIVRAVKQGAVDLAASHPTPRVKGALLDCARLADPQTRVNAAAMLMYLCGKAEDPFDWENRPFYLRFETEDNQELRAVWTELRQRTGL